MNERLNVVSKVAVSKVSVATELGQNLPKFVTHHRLGLKFLYFDFLQYLFNEVSVTLLSLCLKEQEFHPNND